VEILDDRANRGLLAEPPQQTEQQLEQPGLGRLTRQTAWWRSEAREQTSQLGPRRASQLAERTGPELIGQGRSASTIGA
jgi:hypothetical protein